MQEHADPRQGPSWCVTAADLRNPTPQRALEVLIDCFFEAQRETFARVKKDLGSPSAEEDLRRAVTQSIKLAFKEAGHDFANPTRAALEEVVEALARKAKAWGTPSDIIAHHRGELEKVLSAL